MKLHTFLICNVFFIICKFVFFVTIHFSIHNSIHNLSSESRCTYNILKKKFLLITIAYKYLYICEHWMLKSIYEYWNQFKPFIKLFVNYNGDNEIQTKHRNCSLRNVQIFSNFYTDAISMLSIRDSIKEFIKICYINIVKLLSTCLYINLPVIFFLFELEQCLSMYISDYIITWNQWKM